MGDRNLFFLKKKLLSGGISGGVASGGGSFVSGLYRRANSSKRIHTNRLHS
jgi:hypothetical protein